MRLGNFVRPINAAGNDLDFHVAELVHDDRAIGRTNPSAALRVEAYRRFQGLPRESQMPVSWNEIRDRATAFAHDWADESYVGR